MKDNDKAIPSNYHAITINILFFIFFIHFNNLQLS